jgi:hypothetical protein
MAWSKGGQTTKPRDDFNAKIRDLPNNISDLDARLTLAEFLRKNLGFTIELMSGVKLLEMQEILLNGMFLRDRSLIVAGRGVGKSFLIAVLATFYCIFHPNTRLCIVANNFRRSRSIIEQIEKFVNKRDSSLLRACFQSKKPNKLPDCYSWKLKNGSEIFALPLATGEGLRGTRANVLVIDEALLVSESIQKNVLEPFLTSRQNMEEQLKINEIEDELVKNGVMTDNERTIISKNKLIMMSSASFQFEYLYSVYQNFVKNTDKATEDIIQPSYFVARLSYEAVPERTIIDESIIMGAKSQDSSQMTIDREYRALFINASGSYFNIKKLHDCTFPDGAEPTVRLQGFKDEKFILAIDPSYSASKKADYFAMGVYMIDEENKRIIQVHSYARAGSPLNEQYDYLIYLLKSFNIVWVSIDASGTEFIDGFNQSAVAKEQHLSLDYLSVDFDSTKDYMEQIDTLRREHNQVGGKIVYRQRFSGDSIRSMNQLLQTGIDAYRVWFGSRITAHNESYSRYVSRREPPVIVKDAADQPMNIIDFMEEQEDFIQVTKDQLALIEVKATINGVLQFNIPKSARNSENDDRPRRDNYTCALMGYTGAKYYFDMIFGPKKKKAEVDPFFL